MKAVPHDNLPTLVSGPYERPACRIGDLLEDALHGLVVVTGFHPSPMSWPCRAGVAGKQAVIFTAELVRALRNESNLAIAHWWGVSSQSVSIWRSKFDVGKYNEGTRKLLSAVPPANLVKAHEAIRAKEAAKLQSQSILPVTPPALTNPPRFKLDPSAILEALMLPVATTARAPELIGAPYFAPACELGDWIEDVTAGLVQVNGFSDAPFRWPYRKTRGQSSIVVDAELSRAIRLESKLAIEFWWGLSTQTARVLRRKLSVPRYTAGTVELTKAIDGCPAGKR